MALHLTIENETTLPDGGPVSVTVTGKRGIDIGRDAHLDWTLPDPTRYISGKHAEIRYRDGGYWLHDVSTNGTLLNGGDHRMQAPHQLRHGDRFTIGHYIIAVTLDGDDARAAAAAPATAQHTASYQELWDTGPDIAPPIDRAQLRAPRDRPAPVNPDFLDWAADVPGPGLGEAPTARLRSPPVAEDNMSWALGPKSPGPPPPAPPPDIPSPRRPQLTGEVALPWAAERQEAVAPSTPVAEARPPSPLPAVGAGGESADIVLRRLAAAAGLPEEAFAGRDPGEFADQLGAVLRTMVDNVMQLLNARHQAKLLARSSSHTMIQAIDNNPLKFCPGAGEALRIMFGPATPSYLDATRAVQQGFDDLKLHQIKTYSAMQHALTVLMSELDPQSIDRDTDADRGIAALVTSRKARLWDAYVARWRTQLTGGSGPVDRFMMLFAEYYDRGT